MSDRKPRSLWVETTPATEYPALQTGVEVDVAVIGAGIAGVMTAFLLKREGRRVALVDAGRILTGATGYTTAKITAGHNLVYAQLRKKFGEEGARTYAAANEAGLELIASLVGELGIECDFERKPNYVYADTESDRDKIRDEVDAARAAGLDASLVTEVPLPYPIVAAVRLENQAQFHPRKFLLALAETLPGDGSHVFEETRALGVGDGVVETSRGSLRARDVVVATQLPFLDRGLFFAKAHPEMSYAVAARIDERRDPQGMYISTGSTTRSIRTARADDGLLIVLGGEGHKPGADPDTQQRYEALREFGRKHWGCEEFPYEWSTMDYKPVDGVPYIGRLTRRSEHVYVATAFKKWGMAHGAAGALMLRDAIAGRDNPWAALYDANRLNVRSSAPTFVKENAVVGWHFVSDRLATDRTSPDELAPGEGAVVGVGPGKRAVYRDDSGELHVSSARCTHLGCLVRWNTAERSFDCPCHGSRFSGTGRVVHGPAVRDLPRRPL